MIFKGFHLRERAAFNVYQLDNCYSIRQQTGLNKTLITAFSLCRKFKSVDEIHRCGRVAVLLCENVHALKTRDLQTRISWNFVVHEC